MEDNASSQDGVLPHHVQQPLCTTRLPYRQGRKLTAVKVYTVNNESNHLLIFGVPSLNLRQEAKALFAKFGKLVQFAISMEHPGESFTETYHAVFERIQSARLAKRMLDTKTFYGGSLHISYAPEFESISETRNKLLQRQKDVISRLRNLQKETIAEEIPVHNAIEEVSAEKDSIKLNMGEVNIIGSVDSRKRRKDNESVVIEKKFKPCFVSNETISYNNSSNSRGKESNVCDIGPSSSKPITNTSDNSKTSDIKFDDSSIEIVDFTSTERETITNINECLNYNKFGNEVVRKIPEKPVNKIKFNVGNKSLLKYLVFYLKMYNT